MLDSVNEIRAQVLWLAGGVNIGQRREYLPVGDADLEPGQVRAEAEVRSGCAEGHVRVGAAGDDERVPGGEDVLITIRRPVPQHYLVALGEFLLTEPDAIGAHRAAPATCSRGA